MAWWFRKKNSQIRSNSLGAIWCKWTPSKCIDGVPELSDIIHLPRRHVEWVKTHQWSVVLHIQRLHPSWQWCYLKQCHGHISFVKCWWRCYLNQFYDIFFDLGCEKDTTCNLTLKKYGKDTRCNFKAEEGGKHPRRKFKAEVYDKDAKSNVKAIVIGEYAKCNIKANGK